jgi:hypothetical protein
MNCEMLQAPQHGDDEFALTKQDLVACVDAYRQANRSVDAWRPLVGVFGSLLSGAVGATVADSLAWPAWTQPAFFFAGWGGVVAFWLSGRRQHRRLLARTQWQCAHCATPLIGTSGLNPLARAELAIATGNCPSCGHSLFVVADSDAADR